MSGYETCQPLYHQGLALFLIVSLHRKILIHFAVLLKPQTNVHFLYFYAR